MLPTVLHFAVEFDNQGFLGGFQGGSVTAMAINQGVLLGFVPSGTREVNSISLSL